MVRTVKNIKLPTFLTRNARFVALPIMALIAIGVIILAVAAIVIMPTVGNDQRGVGANGFSVFEEKDTDLGVGKVIEKNEIVSILGSKAKSVSDADVNNVVNLNGNRWQTATYNFIRADGVSASLYIDVLIFKDSVVMESAKILAGTASAGKVGNHNAYFMHAFTFGSDREHRLLVVNGLKAYKFVLVQPYRNIAINEIASMAVLKQIAAKSQL